MQCYLVMVLPGPSKIGFRGAESTAKVSLLMLKHSKYIESYCQSIFITHDPHATQKASIGMLSLSLIPTNLVCTLFGIAIPTSSFNFIRGDDASVSVEKSNHASSQAVSKAFIQLQIITVYHYF